MSPKPLLIVIPYPQKSGIFSVYMKAYLAEYQHLGHPVKTEKLYFWENKIRHSLKWLYLIRYFVKRELVILLHQHTVPASGPMILPFLLLGKLLRKKIITVSHETVDTYAKHLPSFLKWIAYTYEKAVVSLSTYYVVHTTFHKQEIESFIQTSHLKVIPHPVVRATVLEKKRAYWGFYGMISAKKGIDLLLSAYQFFPPNTFPPLRIMGTAAPGAEEYLEECKKSVMDDFQSIIQFTGMVPEEEKPEMFSEISLMILPYRYISQSGILAETCMYKIPYLAADLPYFRSFNAEYDCGTLFKPDDIESLKNELKTHAQRPATLNSSKLERLQNELSIENCAAAFSELISDC